ncbi:MAG: ribbon-helix-helix protein, CopG family [Acidobacteriota bacterium]|jgi:hypothetical protein
MRTTITIDDHLMERLKKRAAETGTTLSRLFESLVRLGLAPKELEDEGEDFELVTFGRGGRFTTANVDKISRLLEQDDLERFARKER